ncbi:MAG: hypothetical protein PHU04_05060 [Candidatus Peribacteraceae bacterium]|nr:hypothetical protein [Candidatus Peribacteraceae bacterium]
MTPREIVAKAWDITTKESLLRRWGFASAFLETMLNAKLFAYQAWLLYSYFILDDPIGFFKFETALLEHLPRWLAVSIIIFFTLLILVEWLFPHFAKGAIIGLAAKSYQKEEVKGGLVLAVYNFFPLFAIHEMLVISGLTTAITLSSLSLRYGGAAGFWGVGIVLAIWLFSNILEFFWIFSEEAVVIRKEGIKRSVSRSCKLVISHLGHIVFLMLLLLFIMLRIIANMFMVILVPGIVIGIGFSLAFLMPPVISYSIGALLGIVIIFFASYFFAYLEVFRQSVWTLTYIELCKLKDLDLIEVESAQEAPSPGELLAE